jgi:hypothetical protein
MGAKGTVRRANQQRHSLPCADLGIDFVEGRWEISGKGRQGKITWLGGEATMPLIKPTIILAMNQYIIWMCDGYVHRVIDMLTRAN